MSIFGLNNTDPSHKAPSERLTSYEKPFVTQYVQVVDVAMQNMDALFSRKPVYIAPSAVTQQAILATEQTPSVPTVEAVAPPIETDPAERARRHIAAIHAASANQDQGLAA